MFHIVLLVLVGFWVFLSGKCVRFDSDFGLVLFQSDVWHF